MKHLFTLIVLIGFLGSCTIEKRLYNKGFHVEWSKKRGVEVSDMAQEEVLTSEVKQDIVVTISENTDTIVEGEIADVTEVSRECDSAQMIERSRDRQDKVGASFIKNEVKEESVFDKKMPYRGGPQMGWMSLVIGIASLALVVPALIWEIDVLLLLSLLLVTLGFLICLICLIVSLFGEPESTPKAAIGLLLVSISAFLFFFVNLVIW